MTDPQRARWLIVALLTTIVVGILLLGLSEGTELWVDDLPGRTDVIGSYTIRHVFVVVGEECLSLMGYASSPPWEALKRKVRGEVVDLTGVTLARRGWHAKDWFYRLELCGSGEPREVQVQIIWSTPTG